MLQVTRVGVPSSASCLSSLITYPYLDTAGRRDTIRGLTALAQACSHLSSMSFAGSLLAASGELPLSCLKASEGNVFIGIHRSKPLHSACNCPAQMVLAMENAVHVGRCPHASIL